MVWMLAAIGQGLARKKGHTRIYQWDGTSWNQLGSDIDGEAAEDRSGQIVSLSDGTIVAIGAHENDADSGSIDHNSGHTRIYRWDGSDWTQIGSDIDGEAAGDNSGRLQRLLVQWMAQPLPSVPT